MLLKKIDKHVLAHLGECWCRCQRPPHALNANAARKLGHGIRSTLWPAELFFTRMNLDIPRAAHRNIAAFNRDVGAARR